MIGKEDATKIELSFWLESNGFKVYWERRVAKLPFNVFKVKGTRCKPDLVIEKDGIYSTIEVKTGKPVETFKSKKIEMYYSHYSTGKSKYYINESEIIISYFLIANEYSMYGRLFEESNAFPVEDKTHKEIYGYPKFEYDGTKLFTRMVLKCFYNASGNVDIRDKNIGYGFVLASNLMYGFNCKAKPAFFVMKYDHRPGKNWKQDFGVKLWNTTK